MIIELAQIKNSTQRVLQPGGATIIFFSDEDFKTPQKHIIVTVIIVAATYFVSLITNCLGIILEINVSFFKLVYITKIYMESCTTFLEVIY